jgi:type IV pilus assembly protein PilN
MAGLNLLPWREKEREQKKKQFFSLLGFAAVFAAACIFLAHLYVQSLVEYQNQRNHLLETEIAQLDKQIEEIKKLDATRQALLDRMQIIDTLQSTRPAIVHLFDEIVGSLPKGMYLQHLKQDGTTVKLEGKAESYARVSSFMNRLDASHWLKSSNLNIISTDQKAEDTGQLVLRDFKLDVTQLLKPSDDTQEADQAPKKAGDTQKPGESPNKVKNGGQ